MPIDKKQRQNSVIERTRPRNRWSFVGSMGVLLLLGVVGCGTAGTDAEEAFPGKQGHLERGVVDLPFIGLREITYMRFGDKRVLEGDIILGPTGDETVSAQSAIRLKSEWRWPQGVVIYDIDPNLPNQARVTEAIAHWQANTSLLFRRRNGEADFVFFKKGTGCSSSVGRQGGMQEVELGSGCDRGNVIHEIGHAVGLWHEQSRADRDGTIIIHEDNIQPGFESNFKTYWEKGSAGMDIGPYDLGSIMQYGSYAFSKSDDLATMTRLDGTTFERQREGLSSGDILGVDAMYSERIHLRSGVTWDRCLEVTDSGTANGTPVRNGECSDSVAQVWFLTKQGELRSALAPNRCLDVYPAETAPGTRVQLWDCNRTPGQRWTQSSTGAILSALGSNLCLDVKDASTAVGATVQISGCNNSPAQRWDRAFRLRSGVAWNRCAGVSNSSSASGASVQSGECNDSDAQQWVLTAQNELRSAVAPNRCLEVYNGGTASGTPVQSAACSGLARQRWTFTDSGTVRSNLAGSLCLEVKDSNATAGTLLQISGCNTSVSNVKQQWLRL